MLSLRSGSRILLVLFPAFLLAAPLLVQGRPTGFHRAVLIKEEQLLEKAAKDQKKEQAALVQPPAGKERPLSQAQGKRLLLRELRGGKGKAFVAGQARHGRLKE